MEEAKEGEALSARRTRLFWRLWRTKDPWGGVFLVHGLSEHSGRYGELAGRLNAAGLSVFSFDLRGHGRSQGERGDVASFDDFLLDVAAMEEVMAGQLPGVGKRFLLGHSLGGLVAIRRLVDSDAGYDGVVLSAPWLRAFQPGWIRALGRGLGRIFPSLPLRNGLGPDRLTRDPVMAAAWRADPLIHSRLSGRLFREVERVQGELLARGSGWAGPPALFLIPGMDRVVSSPVTSVFAGGFAEGEVQVEILEGRKHEAFNDLGREEVFEIVTSWLLKHRS